MLEQRTARSAQMLRTSSVPIRLELVTPDVGRPPSIARSRLWTRWPSEKNRPPVVRRAVRKSLQRWTRTQRIRTAASIPVEAVIVDHADVPVYLKIADQAKHLRDLGMSNRAIARALRISDKTVAKAAGAVDVHVPGLLSPEGQSDDRSSPLRLPSEDAPAGCGRGCPHLDGA